jgi:glutamate-1-semialdehyde aminotransferase
VSLKVEKDADGKGYVDYCMAYGRCFWGTRFKILDAVKTSFQEALYGAPTGVKSGAELISKLRLWNDAPCPSTEATMHAIAASYTNRKKSSSSKLFPLP